MFLAILSLNGVAAAGPRQADPLKQPPTEAVAKLIVQLGDAEFRSRQEASDKLAQLGDPVLPALRKAATTTTELEVKRRIQLVVTRIENALLKAEEKRWQDLDAPRRGIKDRIGKIMARTPTLSNQQVASAIYLLTLGRPPTGDKVKQTQKQLNETNVRALSVLQLARSLVQSKEFSAELAAANVRLSKVKQDLATEMGLAQKLARLNGAEFQKLADEVAASVDKAVKADAHFVEVAFLLGMSRFPTASESKTVVAHLKKAGSRQTATSDVFWSMINTREFHLVE
jgi:hypothetical protein